VAARRFVPRAVFNFRLEWWVGHAGGFCQGLSLGVGVVAGGGGGAGATTAEGDRRG